MTMLTRFDRWDPFDELSTLRNRMDRLWTRMVRDDEQPVMADWTPATDVLETKDDIVIRAELSGITEKDVDVEIENGMLLIRGERKAEKETEDKGFRRIERSYGSFARSFALPNNVEPEKIAASFDKGLLEVHLPKKESAKPKAIKVDVRKQLGTPA